MGTLGDRVGLDLMALFGSEEDQDQEDVQNTASEPIAADDAPDGEPSDPGAPPPLEQTLRDLIGELNSTDGEAVDLDAELRGELDVNGLALWAVVAEVERVVDRKFSDADVAKWRTPRDILSAAL